MTSDRWGSTRALRLRDVARGGVFRVGAVDGREGTVVRSADEDAVLVSWADSQGLTGGGSVSGGTAVVIPWSCNA